MPEPRVETDGPVPDGLVAAVLAYERALMADDVAALDGFFAPGAHTLRVDGAGVLEGHDRIAAFRRGRGGAPQRVLESLRVRATGDDAALVVATVLPRTGGRGTQTQLWRHDGGRWRVAVGVVAMPPPAVDPRIWRVVGTPLVPADAQDQDAGPVAGVLTGVRVAVKDLFAIAGQRIGGGVPARLASAPVEQATASAVRMLTAAGASVTGIAQTDELAYSIAGANPHSGTPPNGAVPGALPGGSTSGPASAVATGQADLGLGTDTGGSIRVPASYQGLWGLRTTHGAVAVDGLLPLAPSFDTVGWLTRDAELLALVADVALAAAPPLPVPGRFVVAPATLDGLEPDARREFSAAAARLGPAEDADLGDLDALAAAFRTVQAFEAWQVHGGWLEAHPGAVRGAVADRFAAARRVTAQAAAAARAELAARRAALRDLLRDAVLLLPSAASAAPQVTADASAVDRVRAATLRLTAVAGVVGAPALSVPLAQVDGAPLGVCLVGPPGSDRALIARGSVLTLP